MTTQLRNAPLRAFLLFCCVMLCSASFAQLSRSNNKSSDAYHGQYQRMGTSSNANHSFEIRNGALYASGSNALGQLGDGTTTDRPTPVQIGTDVKWTNIVGGQYHTVALKSDGTLWAWGYNTYGQLGDGTNTSKTAPIQIGTDIKWVSIAAGQNHTVALKSDGTLWAWGLNNFGQLGDGTNTDKNVPTQIGTDIKWTSIAAGQTHTVALKSEGTLWAWGFNNFGQLGDGTTTARNSPTQIGTDFKWTGITAGASHTVALKSEGTLWAWGYNNVGQLGDGTNTNKLNPTQIGTDTKWVSVAAGSSHSIALKSEGTLWSWGNNADGELGDGTIVNKNAPIQIGTDTKWVSISGGASHNLALKSDGTLYAWGYNNSGQLGDGTLIQRNSPVKTQRALKAWIMTATGGFHTVAVKSNGSLWAWGQDANGQLGDGATIDKTTANQIGTDTTWVSVATGQGHSLALKSNGTLWAWGDNTNGQLGDGSTTQRTVPVQIGTDNKWVSIAAGASHSLALKSDGTLWAWGYNNFSQLGDGSTTQRTAPVQIGADTKWVSIACGESHSIALKSDGTLYAWGLNGDGQLGDGTNSVDNVPTQIGIDTKWVSIAGGRYHTVALKSDGTLWAWGNNAYGQLGDGTNVAKNTPTQISSGWISIAGGQYYSFALKSDGNLSAWGQNSSGQLGDGTTTDKNAPTQVNNVMLNNLVVKAAASSQSAHSALIRVDRSNIFTTGYNAYGELGNGTSGTGTNGSSFSGSNSICAALTLPTSGNATYSGRNLSGTGNRTDFQLNCVIAASLTPAGASPVTGTATSKVFVDASVQMAKSTPYVQRHYDIEPATNPNTATANITLYYTQTDFDNFNTARGTLPPLPMNAADAQGYKTNLRMTQYHGVPTGGNNPGNYPTTFGGTGAAHILITPTSVVYDVDNSWWAVTFPVTGFSGFFVSTNTNGPLPVKLLSFTAQKTDGKTNRISWATAIEDAGTIFDVTRSGNGSSFEKIGSAAGKGENSKYSFDDAQPLGGVNYYRLTVKEADGTTSYSNIAIVGSGVNGGGVTITPVPAHNSVTITNTDAGLNGETAIITDMQGREALRFSMNAVNTIDVSNFAAGIYSLRLPGGEIVRIVKQ